MGVGDVCGAFRGDRVVLLSSFDGLGDFVWPSVRSAVPLPDVQSLPQQAEFATSTGRDLVAVYLGLFAVEPDLPGFDQARIDGVISYMSLLGYEPDFGWGEIGCDLGAPEVLGLSDETWGIALWFDDAQQAEQFVDFHVAVTGAEPAGIASGVRVGCAD
jgi:hypothetical protein